MADSTDSEQNISSSYAEWWRYYCQYAQQAQTVQAQQTQGQPSTYEIASTTEAQSYQTQYSTYQATASSTTTVTTSTYTDSANQATGDTNSYYAPYGYYSAAAEGNQQPQDTDAMNLYGTGGGYGNDNAHNTQLENLQKLVAQSVAEAVLKECADNLSQQQHLPGTDNDSSRHWEGTWRGRDGRGRDNNGSYSDDHYHRQDPYSQDDGYWNKRKYNGDNSTFRRPDFGPGSSHSRDTFQPNNRFFKGKNQAGDPASTFSPQPQQVTANPAANVQQQIEMMMKGGMNKRPRVYAPPPKSLTSHINNGMKNPIPSSSHTSDVKEDCPEDPMDTSKKAVEEKPDENAPKVEVKSEEKATELEQDVGNPEIEVKFPVDTDYDPQKKYGEGYIQVVKAYQCHLCGVLLRWESEVQEHVSSRQHYQLFKVSEECENADNSEEVIPISEKHDENKESMIHEKHKDNKNE